MKKGYLIIVGGQSGVGKTTLINELTKKFEKYIRPLSFTTRKRRENENNSEYEFVNEEVFKQLESSGKFATIDFVYGNMYAMSYEDVNKKLDSGSLVIKEIHPKNHNKITEKFENVITVLIKGNKKNNKVREEDSFYYLNIDECNFDIIVNYNENDNIENVIKYFDRKILMEIESRNGGLCSRQIDKVNKEGYDKVSDFFDDSIRVTTANFHELTFKNFKEIIESNLLNNKNVLEVGYGKGWLRKSFIWNDLVNYSAVDISPNMIHSADENIKVISSARSLPFSCESYNYVVSSLADPYFYPEALIEINRVLKEQGLFVFSIPAKEWSSALREEEHKFTTFSLPNGEYVKVYSLTYTEDELHKILKKTGFKVLKIYKGVASDIDREFMSPAILKPMINKNIQSDKFIITYFVICKKETIDE